MIDTSQTRDMLCSKDVLDRIAGIESAGRVAAAKTEGRSREKSRQAVAIAAIAVGLLAWLLLGWPGFVILVLCFFGGIFYLCMGGTESRYVSDVADPAIESAIPGASVAPVEEAGFGEEVARLATGEHDQAFSDRFHIEFPDPLRTEYGEVAFWHRSHDASGEPETYYNFDGPLVRVHFRTGVSGSVRVSRPRTGPFRRNESPLSPGETQFTLGDASVDAAYDVWASDVDDARVLLSPPVLEILRQWSAIAGERRPTMLVTPDGIVVAFRDARSAFNPTRHYAGSSGRSVAELFAPAQGRIAEALRVAEAISAADGGAR